MQIPPPRFPNPFTAFSCYHTHLPGPSFSLSPLSRAVIFFTVFPPKKLRPPATEFPFLKQKLHMSEEIEVDGCECYERLQTSVQYGYLSTVCVCVCVCVRVCVCVCVPCV
mmetsp:Transcript_61459/g.90157  ORF Transcript_61459/g.90157 Transcript_61459/m.90157 type:complete len:110 (+) Transcript_61459:215-544(+)